MVAALSEQELDLMICKGPKGRWHIQFDMNENKAVRDGHTQFSGLYCCCLSFKHDKKNLKILSG